MNGLALGILFVLLIGFVVGPADFENEKLIERNRCAINPHPDFCRGVE
jgi:hypothetical protein